MDDPERKKFYTDPSGSTGKPADSSDDDDELQLMPLDTDVVSAEDRHAKDAARRAAENIDIDEIYREADRDRGGEILTQWLRDFRFRFRFQVKHLLIGTAVLAIALTLRNLGLLWPALTILLMLSIAGLYMYLKWEDRKYQAELDRKRQAMYAARRAQLSRERGPEAVHVAKEPEPSAPLPVPPPNEVDQAWQEAMAKERFRIRFSLRDMLIAMTAAALVMAMIRILGGPSGAATVLGIIALSGLIVHAAGYDPPQIVILGWWFTLVLYVLLSIFAALWSMA